MSGVTEVKQAPGRWDIELIGGTPREIIDSLTPFGHIAIVPGRVDVQQVGDNLLREARYVGVYRGGKVAGEDFQLTGSGVPFWLGDEDGKGPIVESVAASSATFAQTIDLVLPDAVELGTIYSVAGSTTHTFQWQTAKSALNWIMNAFGTPSVPLSWRVNGDCTLDAGPDSQLFNLNPTAILVKKDQVLRTGRGFDIIGISGDMQLEEAYNDYTTKVVVLGAGDSAATIAASASLAASAIPYTDLHGNPVAFTRLIDSLDEDGVSVASALAASLLSRFDSPTYGATLSSEDYDIRGDFKVGDHVAVFAPDIGFVDYSHEIYYEGTPINPMYLQVQGMTWPVEKDWTVAFRSQDGNWLDLTQYYKPTSGQTLIDVGDNPAGLTSLGFDIDRGRIVADSSVPATPVFGTFFTTNYLNDEGDTRAQVLVTWTEPDNTDGSTIIDGSHYEIRYRPNITLPYPATWAEVAGDTWDELFTWMQPRVPPFDTAEWQVIVAPWDVEQVMVNELFPSVEYEFQIRAVDTANPPNRSPWSASQAIVAARDTIPPAQPAVPVVAGSRLAIQLVHYLGTNEGGTFNLDRDTQHLEVHVSGDPLFYPDQTTLVGRIMVGAALASQTPVVATFAVEETTVRYVRVVAVDRSGNRSTASNTATATAELIDDAHISDLTVSKVTAGTITADWLLAAAIKTAASGERMELSSEGLLAYDGAGSLTTNLSSTPSDSGTFISFQSSGETLSAVTSEGVGTFQKVYANQIFVGGDDVKDDVIELRPRGNVAFGSESTDVEGRGVDQYRGFIEIAFDAEENRAYEIKYNFEIDSTDGGVDERFIIQVLDGGDDIPDTGSTNLGDNSFPAVGNPGANATCAASLFKRCPEDIDAGTHRLLLVFKATHGVATLRGSDGPALFWVNDVGPSNFYENIAYLNDGGYKSDSDGGGVSTTPKSSTPLKSYTTTYTCSWSATYDSSNNLMSQPWVGQGSSSTYGQMRGLIGFPSTIATDLVGATVKFARFNAYANYWANAEGGTAVIGWHDYTSAPSTVSTSRLEQDVQQKTHWPKPGAVGVTLDEEFWDALKDGDARGIVLGRAPSTSSIYHGHFDGSTQAHPPTITITYTKQ